MGTREHGPCSLLELHHGMQVLFVGSPSKHYGAVLLWQEAEFLSSQFLCMCKDKEIHEYGFPASSWITDTL